MYYINSALKFQRISYIPRVMVERVVLFVQQAEMERMSNSPTHVDKDERIWLQSCDECMK